MSRTFSPSANRVYGLDWVCRSWRVSRATVYRHRQGANRPEASRRRPGPQGPMPDAALAATVRTVLKDSPFRGEGYRKVWARLRVLGVRMSPRQVLRVMRENDLLAHQRPGSARGMRQQVAEGRAITRAGLTFIRCAEEHRSGWPTNSAAC